LYEDPEFKSRNLAALVVSKVRLSPLASLLLLLLLASVFFTDWTPMLCGLLVFFSQILEQVYYHLGEYEDSLTFALGAGEAFDVSSSSEYTETIICEITSSIGGSFLLIDLLIFFSFFFFLLPLLLFSFFFFLAKCIDKYIKLRVDQFEGTASEAIDLRLESIARRMFKRCFEDGEYKQAIGIALESRDLDILREALRQCGNLEETLQYTLNVAMNLILNKQFRTLVLQILVDLFLALKEPDYESACRCLVFLNEPYRVVAILKQLLENEAVGGIFFLSSSSSFLLFCSLFSFLFPHSDTSFPSLFLLLL